MMIVPLLQSTSVTILGIAFLILCMALCWHYCCLIKFFWNFPGKRAEPYLLGEFFRSLLKEMHYPTVFFQGLLKECKQFQKEGYCVIWLFRPFVIIFNEELNKMLFNEPSLIDKSRTYEITRPLFGKGILLSDGKLWMKQQKLMKPAFYPGVLKGKMHVFNKHAADLVKKLESVAEEPTTEMMEYIKSSSLDALTESTLGVHVKGESGFRYRHLIEKASEGAVHILVTPWLQIKFLWYLFSFGRQQLKTYTEIRKFTMEVINEIKQSTATGKTLPGGTDEFIENRKSLAEILFQQHLKDPEFTLEEIRDQLTTIMFGGHDTTSNCLFWCLYLLGRHTDVQEKAFNEVKSVVTETDVTYEDVCKLHYLESVIKETLRLYPVAALFVRRPTKDISIGEKTIPKGTEVVFNLYALHRNPQIYHDPDKFDPERFSETSQIRPWNYRPFAEGYRSCLGKKFAMMELKIFLAHIIRRLKIKTLDTIEEEDLEWKITLTTEKPLRMLFSLRCEE